MKCGNSIFTFRYKGNKLMSDHETPLIARYREWLSARKTSFKGRFTLRRL